MSHIVLIIIFLVAAVVGYFIINNVPTLLHTPLMSGMNALSGVIGAEVVTGRSAIRVWQSEDVTSEALGAAVRGAGMEGFHIR